MAKKKKEIKVNNPPQNNFLSKFNLEEFIPRKHHVWIVMILIVLAFLIFLNPLYFGNKTFQSGDIISFQAMRPYIDNHGDGYTLWNSLIFCGMPAYAIGVSFKWFNLIAVIFALGRDLFASLFSVKYTMWSFYLIVFGITSYFLMNYLTKNTLISLFTAITSAFSTGIIAMLYIGHVTKLNPISMMPLVILMLLKLQERIRLLDVLILIVALQILLLGFHVQVIFYMFLTIALYFIYYFLYSLIKKEVQLRNNIFKSASTFIIALFIALLIQSDNSTQIYEYTSFSTRGTESIVDKISDKQQSTTSDFYSYHTDWSFSPGEILTFIIPSYYGFGNSTYRGPLTNNQQYNVNTYFGQMPFVDVAQYMGVIVFFLGIFAMIIEWKNPFVRFLTIISIIAIIISFGKNFSILFDLLFYHLPLFNKFRVPSMILIIVQISFPILAGYGLLKIISLRDISNFRVKNIFKNISIFLTSIFVVSLLLNNAITTWFIGRINDYAAVISISNQQQARMHQAFSGYTSGMFTNDLIFALLFLAITAWSATLYVNKRLSRDIFISVIILISIIDLWRIDSRGAQYVPNQVEENLFNEPEYIKVIKSQNDKDPFRILNLKQDGSLGAINRNSNFNAHFLIEDFYGYSSIKPRTYQDIMDVVGPVNQTEWRMLNVRYLITDKAIPENQLPYLKNLSSGENNYVYKNMIELPRAYFVNRVETRSAMDILQTIKKNAFDPKEVAFVEKENLKTDPTDSTAFININEYNYEKITLDVNASGNNFLFLGNTFISGYADYKLFKIPTGWKALVDGTETDIYKTNYGFMGILVPKGKHIVEFSYAPLSFYITKYISLILSLIVVLGLIMTSVFEIMRTKRAKLTIPKI